MSSIPNTSDFDLSQVSKEALLSLQRNYLTCDGLWFLAVEEKYGLDVAVEIDLKVQEKLTPILAKRIAKVFGITEMGIPGLAKTLRLDPVWAAYTHEWPVLTEKKSVIRFTGCPTQEARIRDQRPEFPCKPVGVVWFEGLLKVFLPEAKVRCVFCPPDSHPADTWCEWEIEV